MWKLGRGRVLLDEPPEEEDGLRGGPPPAAAAAQAQRLSVVPSLCFSRAVSWYLFCKQRARDVAHDVGQVPAVLPLRSRKEVTAVKMQGSCECDSCHSPSPSP
ncbi:testis development-related protein isoform X4 [Macaca fascicularis]|uniref:testis development-related protein isoform X4 n=1 Tax=Macaca fascicularis TaxID=9541 RepID=UPI003D159C10